MSPLGFVGLGGMGTRMASRLLAAGPAVEGYNRTREKADPLVALGMTRAGSPRAAAEGAEVVFSSVTDTAALRAVGLGPDGILAGLRRGAVWVEMSTVSPRATRELGAPAAAPGAAPPGAAGAGRPRAVRA